MMTLKSTAYLLIVASGLILSAAISCAVSTQENSCLDDNYPNFRVQFINERVGWIIGPHLFHTIDGGNTWSAIRYKDCLDMIKSRDGPEYRKHHVQFVDETWGWRQSPIDYNMVQYTENGGLSWSDPLKISDDFRGSGLIFSSREKGWVLGENIAVTTDGGLTWKQEASLTGLFLRYPFSLDRDHIWLANSGDVIAHTSDGGKTWRLEHTPLRNIRSIFFITENKGWIVGDDGLIAKTEDGGASWTVYQTSESYDSWRGTILLDVFFLTPDLGWIVGYDGVVLLTTDGGNQWVRAKTSTRARLSSVRFVNPSRGWAVGGYPRPIISDRKFPGVVIETNDGGKTWKEVTFH
jgi:photosystem II stability/assembly factor-like uncharacterized protein